MKISNRFYFIAIILVIFLGSCNNTSKPVREIFTTDLEGRTIVSLTFDDGDQDNFVAGTWLEENRVTATFYVSSGLVGQDGYMNWDQLRELAEAGNEIGGHTLNHKDLDKLDLVQQRLEICDDRQNLIDRGFDAVSFAYPFGYVNDSWQAIVKECGYSSARTVVGGLESIPPANPYALNAYPFIVNDTRPGKLKRYVTEIHDNGGGWIILIFHHVCDDCDFFSVKPEVLQNFIVWLGEEKNKNSVVVLTIGDVMRAK